MIWYFLKQFMRQSKYIKEIVVDTKIKTIKRVRIQCEYYQESCLKSWDKIVTIGHVFDSWFWCIEKVCLVGENPPCLPHRFFDKD